MEHLPKFRTHHLLLPIPQSSTQVTSAAQTIQYSSSAPVAIPTHSNNKPRSSTHTRALTMSCSHDACFSKIPPTLAELRKLHPVGQFPYDWKLDRSVPKCQLCDYQKSQKGVLQADDGSVKVLWEEVAKAEKGGNKDEVEKAQEKVAKAVKKRDEKAEDAMFLYWGVWGKEPPKKKK